MSEHVLVEKGQMDRFKLALGSLKKNAFAFIAHYWSSTEFSENNARNFNFNNGNSNNNKNNTYRVRAIRASSTETYPPGIIRGGLYLQIMQLSLFRDYASYQVSTEELFQAYFQCRKNKRNTKNALKFELDFESSLFQLKHEMESGVYSPGRSIAFIVNKPVIREIFAADFRDRVVHHWLINKLNPLFEESFISDSYACRAGRGTHFGVQRLNNFIQQCSNYYTRDCYVLKLDIEGFFMHINRKVLHQRLTGFIEQNYSYSDKSLVKEITKKVIFNDPVTNCIIKGKTRDWDGLPKNKSLFHCHSNIGLPIGNLTSQVFANFYMNAFDQFILNLKEVDFNGRYVDDFFLVHRDKNKLKKLVPIISDFLNENLNLNLHPKKIYLQHYSKGLKFLGAMIKPGRIYIGNRTKGNFYDSIVLHNNVIKRGKLTNYQKKELQSSVNSYLGIMRHYQSYNIRKRFLLKHLSTYWLNHFYISGGYAKIVSKERFR